MGGGSCFLHTSKCTPAATSRRAATRAPAASCGIGGFETPNCHKELALASAKKQVEERTCGGGRRSGFAGVETIRQTLDRSTISSRAIVSSGRGRIRNPTPPGPASLAPMLQYHDACMIVVSCTRAVSPVSPLLPGPSVDSVLQCNANGTTGIKEANQVQVWLRLDGSGAAPTTAAALSLSRSRVCPLPATASAA